MKKKQQSNSLLNNEVQFLIACCQAEPDPNEIVSQMRNEELGMKNENALINLALRHGILPIIYKTLKKIIEDDSSRSSIQNCPTEIPLGAKFKIQNFFHKLKPRYMSIVQKNMLMSAELIRIMDLFKENDIDALSFKGPALSQMAYGDITLRQFGDLDILIQKADRSKMMALFLDKGYISEIVLQKECEETFFDSVNVIGLYHPSKAIRIEVHWELLSKNYAIDWEEEVLWTNTKQIRINQSEIPVLSVEQHLLYLCAHGSKHLFERLEWVCDIDRSVRTHTALDWDFLLKEAKKLGITRMLFLGLALSGQFFKTPLPEMIVKEISQDKKIPKLISKVIEINFSASSQEGKNYSTFALLWSMRENLFDQLRFAWRGLFAPKFDDFVFIQLPKHLAFLYLAVRPYRLITKYFKR